MTTRVVMPKHLARHFNKSEIELDASDLKQALENLSRAYDLDGILLTPEGHLQPYIRVVVDEDLVSSRRPDELVQVPVAGKTIRIMTAFAGG